MYVIRGADTGGSPPLTIGTTATGDSTEPDPPSVDPGSSEDRLAVVAYGQEANTNGRFTQPSGYTEPSDSDGGTSGGGNPATHCGLGLSYRTYTGQTENPGIATSSVDDGWAAQTIIFDEQTDESSSSSPSSSSDRSFVFDQRRMRFRPFTTLCF